MVNVIAHPTTGLVITPSTKNPEWGTFRVDSTHTSFENGIVNVQKRSAFIRGPLVALNTLSLSANKKLAGQIIKRESYAPFFEGQSPKINPRTQEVVLSNGRETFLEYVYTEDLASCDVFITEVPVAVTTAPEENSQDM
jgi:hypothetical protein